MFIQGMKVAPINSYEWAGQKKKETAINSWRKENQVQTAFSLVLFAVYLTFRFCSLYWKISSTCHDSQSSRKIHIFVALRQTCACVCSSIDLYSPIHHSADLASARESLCCTSEIARVSTLSESKRHLT